MRKNYKLFGYAALAALSFAGCSKDATDDVVGPEQEQFTLTITPAEEIEAITGDGETRTYWDEESETIKWNKGVEGKNMGEYMYLLMYGNEYRLIPNNGGSYAFNFDKSAVGEELFQANKQVLLTGIIPEEIYKYRNITDRSKAPEKITLKLPEVQESTAKTFDPWLDVLVASKETTFTEKDIENKSKHVSNFPFARVMAISKYTFEITNKELSADETVKSISLTAIPAEGHDPILLTGSYNLNISAIPARCIDDVGEPIDLRTPFKSGSESVSTTYPAETQPKLGELAFWPITAPVKLEAGDQLQFRIVTNKHEIVKTITLKNKLLYANNKLNRGTVKLDDDMEMISFADEVDLSARGTANTYLINHESTTYHFRADVKGNGEARTYSWNVEGQPVTKGYTAADLAIRPAEVKLLWYNTPMQASGWSKACPIDPESLVFDPATGYVTFRTPATFVEGNVGIAAFDEAGEILWSWNIWAVESYDYEREARQVERYTVMDRNLGALAGKEVMQSTDQRIAARAIGNYYQWGRKDPFPAAPTYANGGQLDGTMKWGLPTHTPIAELQQDCSALSWGDADMLYSNNAAANAFGLAGKLGDNYKLDDAVAVTVKYPYKWVTNGTDNSCVEDNFYSWHQRKPTDNIEMSEWRYLWGSLDAQTSEKSIYDPCPPGWKVPTGDMYYNLMRGLQTAGTGLYSPTYDLFLPKSGQRQAGFGGSVLSGVGSDIFLSTASVTDQHYPYRAASGGGITSANSYCGAAGQIRCVKEEVAASAAPLGKQNGHRAALMGDSITRTWKDRGRAAFFTENNYANFGADGTTSQNMVMRFNTQVLADDPICAVICCGTNDIADNDKYFRPIEDIFNNIRFMAERAAEHGAKVVIGTAAPTRDMWWQTDEWKALYNGDFVANRIVELNKLIKAYAEERGFGYADYYSALAAEDGDLKEIYWWNGTDHVHPNYDAFIVMEGILKPLIDAIIYDPNVGNMGGNPIDGMDKWDWK